MASPAISSLEEKILARIAHNGPLRFDAFMAMALYDLEHGYYARHTGQVGRHGDFFTSVSTGPLFGKLLARRFLHAWETLGSPARWRVTECGAHDGTLAADVMREMRTLSPAASAALEYTIVEPLPVLRAAQAARFKGAPQRIRQVIAPADLAADPLPGIVFGNEVLDALPCRLFIRQLGQWREKHVVSAPGGGFTWAYPPATDPGIGPRPDGYETEWRDNIAGFLGPLVRTLSAGWLIWIDYGFARPDYYDVFRSSGTLRMFSRHAAGDDPLDSPGLRDITAHVDFTTVAEAGASLGFAPALFESQGAWLTRLAAPLLAAGEAFSPSEIRQFQTLVHPAHLGARFHVLEQSFGGPPEARALCRLAMDSQSPILKTE